MPGIIKAQGSTQSDGVSRQVFNFEDITAQARAALEQIRAEAAMVKQEAVAQAEEVKKNAIEAGKAEALKQAREEAKDELERKVSSLLPTLEKAAQQLVAQRDAWLAMWEKQALLFAIRMAEKIVRRELAADPSIPVTWIKETLELIGQQEQVTVEVSAADHATLSNEIEVLQQSLHRIAPMRVVASNALKKGDCRVTTQYSDFDHRLSTMMERLENELT